MKLLVLFGVVLSVAAQKPSPLFIRQTDNRIVTGNRDSQRFTRQGASNFVRESSIDEVAGQQLGDLTTDLQIQAQAAYNDLLSNPNNANSIIQTLAMRMSQSIATLISQLAQEGITNPTEEAAQIAAAVRLALEATLAGSNGMITSRDVILVVNQLVGQLENILASPSVNLPTEQIQQMVMGPLLNALQQVFGVPVTPVVIPVPAQMAMPTPAPTLTPTPTPTLTPTTNPTPTPPVAAPTTVVQTPSVSDIAGGSYQTFIFTSSGKRVLVGGCFDIVPPGGFTCEEQNKLGKCGRRWMSEGNFCAQTCGYCQDECLDIQPDLETTCEEVRELGLCNSEGIVSNEFCKQTCNNCGSVSGGATVTPPPSVSQQQITAAPIVTQQQQQQQQIGEEVVLESCVDVSPDPQYSCAQQKEFGKCDAAWMVQGRFCTKSCGRCGAPSAVQQPAITQVAASTPGCTDVVPDGKYTCLQQKEFGKCNAQWMLAGGYCQRTCERCNNNQQLATQIQQQLQNNQQCPPCDCQNINNQGDSQSETVAQLLAAAIEQVLQDLGV